MLGLTTLVGFIVYSELIIDITSSYPGWIKSPHVVTRGILKLSDLDSLTIFILGGGGTLPSQNSKFQDLPKFQISGGGYSQPSQNSKCQDLPKFQILGGKGGRGR